MTELEKQEDLSFRLAELEARYRHWRWLFKSSVVTLFAAAILVWLASNYQDVAVNIAKAFNSDTTQREVNVSSNNTGQNTESVANQETLQPVVSKKLDAPNPLTLLDKYVALYQAQDDATDPVVSVSKVNEVYVVSEGEQWSQVESRKQIPLWVASAFLQEQDNGQYEVNADSLNARSKPSAQSRENIVVKLPRGERLDFINNFGEWSRVAAPRNLRLWVRTEELNRLRSES